MRCLWWLVTGIVLTAGVAAEATPRPCVPLVVDDQGDGDSLVPVPREDLDVLAADLVTSPDAKRVSMTMTVASLPAQAVAGGVYNVFFKAGQRSYVARAYRGADDEVFQLESDAPPTNGLVDVRAIKGAFDPAKASLRFDIPLAMLSDGKRALRRGDRLFGISGVTVQAFGAAKGYAGFTVDATSQDNIYKIGASGCARR